MQQKTIGDEQKSAHVNRKIAKKENLRDPVTEYHNLSKSLPGLSKRVQEEVKKRNIKTLAQVEKLVKNLRNKRLKSKRNPPPSRGNQTVKSRRTNKLEFTSLKGKGAKKLVKNLQDIAQHVKVATN